MPSPSDKESVMHNILYLIGVVVVDLALIGFVF